MELFSTFLLHRCAQGHHHYHVVCGPEVWQVSAPFSTLGHGRRVLQMLPSQVASSERAGERSFFDRTFLAYPRKGGYQLDNEDHLFERENVFIVNEMKRLATVQYREQGRFLSGFLIEPTRKSADWERWLTSWEDFVFERTFYGRRERIGFYALKPRGGQHLFREFVPLKCDFVSHKWGLYGDIAVPRSPRELGLKP